MYTKHIQKQLPYGIQLPLHVNPDQRQLYFRVQLPPETRDDMMNDIIVDIIVDVIVSLFPRNMYFCLHKFTLHSLLPTSRLRCALVSRYNMTLPFKVSAA